MTKRLLLLGGLAILAVVLSHAAGYGQIALFLWADSYFPVKVPYWDALGSVSHYGLLVIRSIGTFAVPAFLFISGFFSVYVVGRKQSGHEWRSVLKRVLYLFVPYLFWSAIIFAIDALQGKTYQPLEYAVKLLTTGASGHLYYVPLLCICYLLSPRFVKWAKKRPGLLLSVSILLQMGLIVAGYLAHFGISNSVIAWIIRITPDWSFPRWFLFFVLGLIVALNIQKAKEFLANYRGLILVTAVVSWLLNILEGDAILQTSHTSWFAGISTISSNLFAISAVACFLAFSEVRIPWSRALNKLSTRSYGIYLMHVPLIDLIARVIRQIVPRILAYQVVLVPFLFIIGLGLPLLTMEIVNRLPRGRNYYRYLFG